MYIAVASPSVSGFVAIMTSRTSPVATRCKSSRILMSSSRHAAHGTRRQIHGCVPSRSHLWVLRQRRSAPCHAYHHRRWDKSLDPSGSGKPDKCAPFSSLPILRWQSLPHLPAVNLIHGMQGAGRSCRQCREAVQTGLPAPAARRENTAYFPLRTVRPGSCRR